MRELSIEELTHVYGAGSTTYCSEPSKDGCGSKDKSKEKHASNSKGHSKSKDKDKDKYC